MTVVNGSNLLAAQPIVAMVQQKLTGPGGTSYGLGEAGYDIRIKQDIHFLKNESGSRRIMIQEGAGFGVTDGRFALASAMDEFDMPNYLMGIVHDKSTWARRGLSVFNTVIEPGWAGFLTLELVYHGEDELIIPAGSGIAQVVFHLLECEASYTGKYQNQADKPAGPIASE